MKVLQRTISMAIGIALAISLSACNGAGVPPASTETNGNSAAPVVSPTPAVITPTDETENTGDAENAASVGSPASADAPMVYFTSDISSQGLQAVYDALNWTPTGKVAVKITTGEPPNSNYLRVELIGDLVKSVNGTFVECNTAYGGSRANTAMHMQVAKDHGYTAVADVDIQDADGSMSLTVTDGTQLAENFVGAHFANYDSYLVLSHFKGHQMAGFGGGQSVDSYGRQE